MIKDSCDIIGRSPSRKVIILPSLVAIGPLVMEINGFCLSRDLTKSCNQGFLWLGACVKVYHHPSKFGGHRHCASLDKMVLVCPVILQNHVIKEWCNFFGRNSLSKLWIGTLVVDIFWFLIVTWPCKTTWSKRKMALRLGVSQSMSSFYVYFVFTILYVIIHFGSHRHSVSREVMIFVCHLT